MPYANLDAYRTALADRRFWRRLAWRTAVEGLLAIPGRVRARRVPVRALTRRRPLASADLPLILVTRNHAALLPAFLRHYRSLGVTRFIVLDDRSSDGTRDILAGCDDVDLWSSDVRYATARHGLAWVERLVRTYGRRRWYVHVDSDEFLVYDGMNRHRLPALCGWLTLRGERRLLAPLVDCYPAGPLSTAALAPDRWPWEVATHFDAAGYEIATHVRTTAFFGGPRARVFGVRPQLAKFPLQYWDRRTCLPRTPHTPYPYVRNFGTIAGAVLHFKFFDDFPERVRAAVADQQYWQGATEYRAYDAFLRRVPDPIFVADVSRAYTGVGDLVELGYVAAIDWAEARHRPSAPRPSGPARSVEPSGGPA
jgi:hypothetical protein